ncbi:hypothetical protein B484DRAFT_400579, partial [Ochromonadaceae sp. CCMP2298]
SVVLKPAVDPEDTDAVWVMESRNIVKGGLVKFRTDRVHYRHLNSGQYLSLHQQADLSDNFTLRLSPTPSEIGSLFQVQV